MRFVLVTAAVLTVFTATIFGDFDVEEELGGDTVLFNDVVLNGRLDSMMMKFDNVIMFSRAKAF